MPDMMKLEELWKNDTKDFFWLCDNFLPCVLGNTPFENNFVKANILLWKEVSCTDVAFVIYMLQEKANVWEHKYTQDKKQMVGEGGEKTAPQDDEVSSVSQDGCKGKTKKQRLQAYRKVEKVVVELKGKSGDDIAIKYHQHRADIINELRARKNEQNKEKKRKREEEPEEEPMFVDSAFF